MGNFSNRSSSYPNRLMAATALLSVALIAYQVSIIQMLSYVQWYHYANMIISIALLGFGAAGSFLSVFRDNLVNRSEVLVPISMILSGLTMVMAVWFSRHNLARFDSLLLFVESSQWLALILNYLFFFLPFFFGALALGIIFVKYVIIINTIYFFNLLGSGIGALIIVVLADYFFPVQLPIVIAFLAIIPGLLLLQRKNKWMVILVAVITTAFIIGNIAQPVDLRLSEYKSLSRTLNLPSAKIILQKPSPYGFTEVISADALRFAPGLSLAFTGEVPVKKAVFNNGDWYGALVSWNNYDSTHLLDYTTMALPYVMKQRDKVLVLNAGTGLEVSHAISRAARQVDAVEVHQTINKLLLNELAAETDSLYYHPGVNLHSTEPRTYLSMASKKYDLVQLPMIGAFGGGSGLYAMKEEYLLTKESFLQAWNLLEENGVISINCWMDYPFRNPLKVAATIAETAKAAGLNSPTTHIAAVRSWATTSFILKKTPLDSQEISLIRKFCDSLYFDPLLLPGLTSEERTVYNQVSDSSFFNYTDELISGDDHLYEQYDFYLRPATDDKPYFSQFLRMKSLPHLKSVFGSQAVPFLELGWLISIITFIQLTALAILLIIFPLFRIGWTGTNRLPVFFYFSGLGIGYMLLEIVMIQRFILFFGNPVEAVSLVIASMLVASGAGSYYSSRILSKISLLQKLLFIIVIFLLVYSFFLPAFLQEIITFPAGLKLVISILIIAAPSFLMGMPFPTGLKLLSTLDKKNIPWAWAINGCMSVISAALAALLAVELGFSLVMLLAALSYAVCALAIKTFSKLA